MSNFLGYRRADGTVGARNYVAVIPTVGCVNEVARRISQAVDNARPVLHHQGCGQMPPDLEQVARVLIGLGSNPNVGAAVVVSLGCEGVPPQKVADGIAATGRPVRVVSLMELGGYSRAVAAGIEAGKALANEISDLQREPFGFEHLIMGIKCGASDTTSGLASNPAVGVASDTLLSLGGTSIFCETTELMGAEHVVAGRAVSSSVGECICRTVNDLEKGLERFGVDMRGGQPTRGNIAGGISTIEEKSLGAICKSGHARVQSVLRYGERPSGRGLYFMDSPGREMEVLTGLASTGAQVLVFSTGLGAPQGFPLTPVVKVSGNARTCAFLAEHIDVDVSGVVSGTLSLADAGRKVLDEILAAASGRETKAEIIGYTETMDIFVAGPPI